MGPDEEGRTPNAISTPPSTFVLVNRGGLVGHNSTGAFPALSQSPTSRTEEVMSQATVGPVKQEVDLFAGEQYRTNRLLFVMAM